VTSLPLADVEAGRRATFKAGKASTGQPETSRAGELPGREWESNIARYVILVGSTSKQTPL